MIKKISKITMLLIVSYFIFLGCEDKTVISENKTQIVQDKSLSQKALPQGNIKTH